MKPVSTSIFETIRQNPKFHQSRSADWFRDKIRELAKTSPISRVDLFKTTKEFQTTRLLPGVLSFFAYDPKHKETLPYYDKFPLSFIFSIEKDRFSGINFHYLPIPIRIKLYDAMYNIAKQTHLPSQQVMALSWSILQNASKFPGVRPAVKQYLFNHVQSRFIKIPIEDWKTAIMLENSEFKKASASNVRTISARIASKALMD